MPRKILVSTTQRCGSSWVAIICRGLFDWHQASAYVPGIEFGLLDVTRFDDQDEVKVEGFSKLAQEAARGSPVLKTHDLPVRFVTGFLERNPDFAVVNVHRDFRDVLISRIMYNRHHLPSKGRKIESKFIESHLDLGDRELVQRFLQSPEFLAWFTNWKIFAEPCSHPRYLALSYERMLSEEGLLEAVLRLRDLALLDETEFTREDATELARSVTFDSFLLNGQKQRATREIKSDFCRKGVAGDFINYLTPMQAKRIEILMG